MHLLTTNGRPMTEVTSTERRSMSYCSEPNLSSLGYLSLIVHAACPVAITAKWTFLIYDMLDCCYPRTTVDFHDNAGRLEGSAVQIDVVSSRAGIWICTTKCWRERHARFTRGSSDPNWVKPLCGLGFSEA